MTTWIVAGGRRYANERRVFQILDAAVDRLALTRLIEGGASGADALACKWRKLRGVDGKTYEAQWNNITHPKAVVLYRNDGSRYDSSAGRRRNQQMLDEEQPVGLIAFLGGAGTEDMIRRAWKAEIRVITVDWKYP